MNLRKITFAFVLILLGSTACDKDFLEKTPLDQGSVEGFFETEEDVFRALNGIYDVFQGTIWGGAFYLFHPHFDGVTDNALLCCAWEGQYSTIARGEHNPTTGGIISNKWDFGYEGIFRANSVLDNIDRVEMDEETRTKVIAEARFLRGMIYAELATLYGDVPLVENVISRDEGLAVTRESKEKVMDAALADLDFAEANLDMTPLNGQIGRPTKQSAIAVKTRYKLYSGDFQGTVTEAQKIMNMSESNPGMIGLEDDYESVFSPENENNKEVLFDIQYVEGTQGEGNFLQVFYAPGPEGNPGNGWGSVTPLNNLVEDFGMVDGMSIDESPMYDPNNPYENRDPRLFANLFVPGVSEWKGGTYTASLSGFSTTGFQVRKWVDLDAQIGEDGCSCNETNLILYRYADILMMFAEAMNEMSGPTQEVYDAVNAVRQRAGIADLPQGLSQAEMREAIRHERRVEFLWEGTRYFDLLRWGIAKEVITGVDIETRIFEEPKNLLWPIPQAEIDLNPNLVQNPGY